MKSATTTEIIQAGLRLWREGGEAAVSARKIAAMVGMTHGGILHRWRNPETGPAERLRYDIACAAVAAGDPVIIRQLIVAGHPAVADMDQTTRRLWLSGA